MGQADPTPGATQAAGFPLLKPSSHTQLQHDVGNSQDFIPSPGSTSRDYYTNPERFPHTQCPLLHQAAPAECSNLRWAPRQLISLKRNGRKVAQAKC